MKLSATMYAQMRAIAGRYLRGQPGHTLQPTALVNEAYLKLDGRATQSFESREHFMAVAARVMRHVLVDHARRHAADKRDGQGVHAAAPSVEVQVDGQAAVLDVLAIDEALTELARLNGRHARVVELKFFAGVTTPEIARALGVSVATVERDWQKARAWLLVRLGDGD